MSKKSKIYHEQYRAVTSDVGKTLAVFLKSDGNGEQQPTKSGSKRVIAAVYPDTGAVKDDFGEVWFIRPYTKYGTDFVAVK